MGATVMGLILVVAAAQVSDRDSADFAEAAALREAGRYAQALEVLERLHARTGAVELLNNIGWLLERLGRLREASAAYRRVVEDPAAPPQLVQQDRERLEVLAPRLDRAWLSPPPSTVGCWVDGRPWAGGAPLGLTPGSHAVEVHRPDSGEGLVRWLELEAGREASLAEVVRVRPDQDGVLRLDPAGVSQLSLQGLALSMPTSSLRRIWLAPGRYQVTGETLDGHRFAGEVAIHAGEPAGLPPPTASPDLALGATPEPPPSEPSLAPWFVGAGAVALAGAAVGFHVAARADRRRVDDAALDANGVVVGITMAEAEALTARADDRDTLALGLAVSAGVAAVVTTVWLLLQ